MTSPPFVAIDGIFNSRDIGGYRSCIGHKLCVRRGHVYRCANPSRVTPEGIQQLRRLGIKKIFDLRSNKEIEHTADFGVTSEIAGIKRVNVPMYVGDEYPSHQSPQALENYASANRHVLSFNDPCEGRTEAELEYQDAIFAYVDIMAAGGPALRTILVHLRNHPSEACLIHCSAGKDRTGVAIALILAIAGVNDEDIISEYRLTEEGLMAMRPFVMRYLQAKSGSEWTDQQISELLDIRYVGEGIRPREEAYQGLTYDRYRLDAMIKLLIVLRTTYHGADGYLRSQCGFSDNDITTIKKNLLASQAQNSTPLD